MYDALVKTLLIVYLLGYDASNIQQRICIHVHGSGLWVLKADYHYSGL